MSQFFYSRSRRKCLNVAGASTVSSIFLKGCLGYLPNLNAKTQTMGRGFYQNYFQDFDPVNHENIWREAAMGAGFSDLTTQTSQDVKCLFDGIKFKLANLRADGESLPIQQI